MYYFHPRNKGPSCLKGAWGCVNTNIYKKYLSNIFKLFFKKESLKKSHLNTTDGEGGGLVDRNPHFLGSGV